jgi:4-methyl-5(b-hydroxyethyl)-thiazole monophosphate biosynthesis
MVYILLGNGFEEIEAIAPGDISRRGGADVRYAAVDSSSKKVAGGHGIAVMADITLDEISMDDLEMIVVPGGLGGVEAIQGSRKALECIVGAKEKGAYVAAICAGPKVLAGLGMLEGKNAVCYPGLEEQITGAIMHPEKHFVVDGQFITGRGPGSALDFGLALLEALCGKTAAQNVKAGLHYDGFR